MTLIRTLGEEYILEYCSGDSQDRAFLIDGLCSSKVRPACLLPLFELCHVVHFWAAAKGRDPRVFRECWEQFVQTLWERSEKQGPLIGLLDSLEGEDISARIREIIGAKFEYRDDGEEEEPTGRDERRSGARQHKALVARMRFMYGAAEARRQQFRSPWEEQPPDTLPVEDPEERDTTDLVLDTNNLLELLQGLVIKDGRIRLSPQPWLSERVVRQFKRSLETNGTAGSLIIPISVLEETERVARKKAHAYSRVTELLNEIAMAPERMPWGAVVFENLTIDVFSSFLRMHEVLFLESAATWPSLGDALVLAHGLTHGCPVASTEWNNQKEEWRDIGKLFPFLIDFKKTEA